MVAKTLKTNAMRILDQAGISYQVHDVRHLLTPRGIPVQVGEAYHRFKTLVAIGKSKQYYVFVIPINDHLDLKKAATITAEKYIEMIPQKDLLNVTGYVHGGCSPLGMKKSFPTYVHQSLDQLETLVVSAGKIGIQIELSTQAFKQIMTLEIGDLVEESN